MRDGGCCAISVPGTSAPGSASRSKRNILIYGFDATVLALWGRACRAASILPITAKANRPLEHLLAGPRPHDIVLLDYRCASKPARVWRLIRDLRPTPIAALVWPAVTPESSASRAWEAPWVAAISAPRHGSDYSSVLQILLVYLRQNRALERFGQQHRLSQQEALLLASTVCGFTNDQAADHLGCRRGTLGTYWKRIFLKIGQRSQRDVVAALFRDAIGNGW